MMIVSATNPLWANAEHTAIDLRVNFLGLGEQPFTARSSAAEAYVMDLFERALGGEFGQVGEFVPPPFTEADYTAAVQSRLDLEAKTRRYDSILSACSYAAMANDFQAEGQAFLAWRSAVWTYCYQALDDVHQGRRPQPTIDELISELPHLVLP